MAKVYTVRNDKGDTFQVDEDKVSLAEQDGYLPVVSNGKEEHRVSTADFHLAEKDGYKPLVDLTGFDYVKDKASELWETTSDTAKSIKEGIPLHGAAEKLGMAINAALPDAIQPAQYKGKSWSDIYNAQLAEDNKERDDRYARSPIASTAGNVLGGFIAPNPASITGRVVLNVADAATRGDNLEQAGENGLIAGGVSTAFERLPYVGKGLKAVKRLIPGTEGAYEVVNKGTAKLAALVPSQSASSDEIYELLNNTEMRRAARKTNLIERAAELLPKTDDALKVANKSVGDMFSMLEEESLGAGTLKDALGDRRVYDELLNKRLPTIFEKIDAGKEFYGRTPRKLADETRSILEGKGVREYNNPTYKMDVFREDPSPAIATTMKQRVLDARRNLDDFMKNKKWKGLRSHEQDIIKDLRETLDSPLKSEFTGAAERVDADALYSGYKKVDKELREHIIKRGKDGASLEKVHNSLRSGSTRGAEFDTSLEAYKAFFKNNEHLLGNLKEVKDATNLLSELRETGAMDRLLEKVKKAGGGPTSQSINTALQLAGAKFTGGYSLLFLPITNPSGWASVLDELAGTMDSKTVQRVKDAVEKASNKIVKTNKWAKMLAEAAAKGNKQLAITHFLLMQRDPDYRAVIFPSNI